MSSSHCVKILNLYNYVHNFDFCPFQQQLLWFWNWRRCQSYSLEQLHKMLLWIGSTNLQCDSLGKKRTAACEVWTLIKFHSHSRRTVISNIPLGNIDANCTLAIFCLCSLFCLVDHIWGRWRMISSFRADKESNGMQSAQWWRLRDWWGSLIQAAPLWPWLFGFIISHRSHLSYLRCLFIPSTLSL